MARPRRTCTAEFKAEAVQLVTERGYSVAGAARWLAIHETPLRFWKQALQDKGAPAFPCQGKLPALEDELRCLRADNKRLPAERGSQYASEHYQRLLAQYGITCSMTRCADCWDNAPIEEWR